MATDRWKGSSEKYGMESLRKPKWDETPDEGLSAGHDWKIFPILHRRHLFADVEQFFLYDLYRVDGGVDETSLPIPTSTMMSVALSSITTASPIPVAGSKSLLPIWIRTQAT